MSNATRRKSPSPHEARLGTQGLAALRAMLGGTHCVSMCGGIVGALSVQVHTPAATRRQWPLHLAYNLGRIATYTAVGGALGALGSVGMLYEGVLPVQLGLYVLTNLMLVALGLLLAPRRASVRLVFLVERSAKRFHPVDDLLALEPAAAVGRVVVHRFERRRLRRFLAGGPRELGRDPLVCPEPGEVAALLVYLEQILPTFGLLIQLLECRQRGGILWIVFANGVVLL